MHPVVMHSRLLGLLCGAVTGIGAESRAIRDRVPPSVEHLQHIGFGNAYQILSADAAIALKPISDRPAVSPRGQAEKWQYDTAETQLQQAAAHWGVWRKRCEKLLKMRVRAVVADRIVIHGRHCCKESEGSDYQADEAGGPTGRR
jgi:hypothetical protein